MEIKKPISEYERRKKLWEIARGRPFTGKALSEEEVAKIDAKRYKENITPEFLAYFTEDEAFQLVRCFDQTPTSTTQDWGGIYDLYYRLQDKDAREYLKKQIKGKKIIELGDNGNKINETFFLEDCEASAFETTDPKYGADGLTYLIRQAENSAIVVSFGVLEEGILYRDWDKAHKLLKKYTAELGKQIYRVTPKNGITFHGLEWDHDLLNAGFAEDINCPKTLNTRTPQHGGFRVLRK